MVAKPVDQKQNKEHIESLQRAIRVLESRVVRLEMQNRTLDALVRRSAGEAQRATQLAQQAKNEITQVHSMLSRRG